MVDKYLGGVESHIYQLSSVSKVPFNEIQVRRPSPMLSLGINLHYRN